MPVYDHTSFDEYKQANIDLNIKKLNRKISESRIIPICNFLKNNGQKINTGICHGVRNGTEVEIFSKQLGCDVIGTDISPTANEFNNCIEWDFHNIKDEWVDHFDFVYSNALDHSHSPEHCIYQWIRQLKSGGFLFIEWAEHIGHTKGTPNAADCFIAKMDEFKLMLDNLGIKYKYDFHCFIIEKQDVDMSKVKNKYE